MTDKHEELNNNGKIPVELGSVQKTLLLPLWGRAIEARKKDPLIIDGTAIELIDKLDYDFSAIAASVNEVTQTGWIARSLLIDRIIKRFLEKNPQTTIVNIGCGFDTTFDRVDNGKINWYDLDLPDVIDLRRRFIPEDERRKFIASSFLDYEWFDQLKVKENILFVAAGVLCYFEEHQIKDFFMKIADSFPNSEMIFDAFSPIAIKISNKMVLKDGGMDEKASLKWGLKRASSVSLWDNRIKVLGEYLLYKKMKRGLSGRGKILTLLSDRLRMLYMVHLKLIR
jgi:O-methyltransferase involved in polyketide biosynthesis